MSRNVYKSLTIDVSMIIGVLLGVSLGIMFASMGLIVMGMTGAIRENIITGAVIGTTGVVSYSVIAFVLSSVAVFFLSLVLKKPKKGIDEY